MKNRKVGYRKTSLSFVPEESEQIEYLNSSKRDFKESAIFNKTEILVESQNLTSSYLIFGLNLVSKKHKISIEEILVCLYLHELGLFSLSVVVLHRWYKLAQYINKGLITEDYIVGRKTLYKLTKKGNDVVVDFNNTLGDNTGDISKNRETDMGLDNEVKSALADYFG